jgi:hypothetical protein
LVMAVVGWMRRLLRPRRRRQLLVLARGLVIMSRRWAIGVFSAVRLVLGLVLVLGLLMVAVVGLWLVGRRAWRNGQRLAVVDNRAATCGRLQAVAQDGDHVPALVRRHRDAIGQHLVVRLGAHVLAVVRPECHKRAVGLNEKVLPHHGPISIGHKPARRLPWESQGESKERIK